jgi:acyl-CoA thioesterase-1
MRRRLVLAALMAVALGACARSFSCGAQPTGSATDPLAVAQPTQPSTNPDARTTVIAFLGDSLTAGLGLTSQQAYPNRIQEMFTAEGYGEVEALNGGISGDTTAGGLRRVEQLLGSDTKILVVALGGNDALRGLTVAQTHDNLSAIVRTALDRNIVVMLAGMEAPTNYGEDYRSAFHNAFVQLSQEYKGSIDFVPFLLEGVAGNSSLNQSDGIHPNEQGARLIAELLYPRLRNIVDRLSNGAR